MLIKKISLMFVILVHIFSIHAGRTLLNISLSDAAANIPNAYTHAHIELLAIIRHTTGLTDDQIVQAHGHYMMMVEKKILTDLIADSPLLAKIILMPAIGATSALAHLANTAEVTELIHRIQENEELQEYINARDEIEDDMTDKNNSALHYAASLGFVDIVKLLTLCSANILQNNILDTPIHDAITHCPPPGANVNVQDIIRHPERSPQEMEPCLQIVNTLCRPGIVGEDDRLHVTARPELLNISGYNEVTARELLAERPILQRKLRPLLRQLDQ